jgi:hypothetical protein
MGCATSVGTPLEMPYVPAHAGVSGEVLRLTQYERRISGMHAPCPIDAPPTQQPVSEVEPVYNFRAKKRYKHRAAHRAVAPQLLTRDKLDTRRGAVKVFDAHARAIQNDLGGVDRLSAIELALVDTFVGASLTMSNMNCRIMLGEEVDMGLHALVGGLMVKLASRLGIERRPRDVSPSLSDYLKAHEATS